MSLPFEFHDVTAEKAATALLYLAGPGHLGELRLTTGRVLCFCADSIPAGVDLAREIASGNGDTVVVFLPHHGVLPRRCSA